MGPGFVQRHAWRASRLAAFAAAVLAALLLASPGRAAGVPLSLSITGNHFVDGSGRTIRLLGVNHASSEYACVDGYGYNDGFQNDADAAAIAAWHANAVRIPLNEDCWLGINGQPNSSQGASPPLTQAGYQQAVKDYVSALNAHGIYAILDLHWSAPGGQVALEQQPMPDASHAAAFWSSVASSFKDNRAVVFDLYNEPYDPTDPRSGADQTAGDKVTWNCWQTGTENGPAGGSACSTAAYDENGTKTTTYPVAGMQTLLDAVRATGATEPVLIGGLDYANDLTQWAAHKPADSQVAASFHNYQGKACDNATCWNATIAPVAANVPVVTGEFAEDDFQNSSCANRTPTTFDADYMSWADQHGVGYLAWGWELLAPPEISGQGCSAYFLTSDHAGTPAAPNGTAVHDHLVALATAPAPAPPVSPPTPTPTPIPNPTPTAGAAQPIKLTSVTATVRPGATTVVVSLRASRTCTGTLNLRTAKPEASAAATSQRRPHRLTLATAHFRLTAGRRTAVMVTLSRAGRRLLLRTRSLQALLTVTLMSGRTHTTTHRTVTLRAAAARRHR